MAGVSRIPLSWVAVALTAACSDPEAPPSVPRGDWAVLGLETEWVTALARDGERLYAATDDGLYSTAFSAPAAGWAPRGLQGRTVWAVLPLSADTILAAVAITGIGADTLSLWRTIDGGATWHAHQNGFGAGEGSNEVGALARLPESPSTLLATGGGTMLVARSDDLGATWRPVWGGRRSGGTGTHFLVADLARPGVLWAGGETGILSAFLIRSTDGGTHWEHFLLRTGGDNACYRAAIDPRDSEVVYVGMEGRIMRTADGGRTWRTVLSAPAYFKGLAVSRVRPGRVYAAAGSVGPDVEQPLRLYLSDDRGTTWHEFTREAQFGTAWDLLVWADGATEHVVVATATGIYRFTPVP